MTRSWNFSRWFLSVILAVVLTWGSMLVVAAVGGRDGPIISGMFETVGLLTGWIIAIQIGGKAWKEFMPLKWGGDAQTTTRVMVEKETVEK